MRKSRTVSTAVLVVMCSILGGGLHQLPSANPNVEAAKDTVDAEIARTVSSADGFYT